MNNNSIIKSRKNLRLKEYDYSQNGMYFITICTKNRKNILCKISSEKEAKDIVGNDALVVPSEIGKFIINCWNNISKINTNILTYDFVLMPNHIHGIIFITEQDGVCEINKKYGFEILERRGRRSLQSIIKDFKSVTTRKYNEIFPVKNELWQKSYYEHIIRNEKELLQIQKYILENPLKWNLDKYYN